MIKLPFQLNLNFEHPLHGTETAPSNWHPGIPSGSLQNRNLKSHLRDADLFPIGTPYGYYRGTFQLCLSLDVGRPHVVMYVLLLFSIVSISLLLRAVY